VRSRINNVPRIGAHSLRLVNNPSLIETTCQKVFAAHQDIVGPATQTYRFINANPLNEFPVRCTLENSFGL
jgi:hypothetical protein